jgi:hypothetical protein
MFGGDRGGFAAGALTVEVEKSERVAARSAALTQCPPEPGGASRDYGNAG